MVGGRPPKVGALTLTAEEKEVRGRGVWMEVLTGGAAQWVAGPT
jgi:hypothetical protein